MKKTFGDVDLTERDDGSGHAWRIQCQPQVSIVLKQVFQNLSVLSFGTHVLSDTLDNARNLEWLLMRHPMMVSKRAAPYLRTRANAHRERERSVDRILSDRFRPKPVKLALPLRTYQLTGVEMVRAMKGLLVADDLGLGKTAIGIGVGVFKDARPMLVVTLTALPIQWAEQFAKFAPELLTHIVKGTKPYDFRVGKRGKPQPMPDVIIMNYQKLAGWAETLAPMIKSVVFDECQELRLPGSQKYAGAVHVRARTSYRCGLSATPIYNDGAEFHSVMEVLRPGELGTRSEFLRERCREPNRNGGAMIIDPRAFGEHVRQQGLMLRRTRKEVGRELPPLTRIPQHVDADFLALNNVSAPCRELSLYILGQGKKPEHFDGTAVEIDGEVHAIDGKKKSAHWLASQELSWRLRQATGIAKAPFVADFVRLIVEQEQSVILYGWHREVYSIWLDRLANLSPMLYTGTESPREKELAKQKFMDRGTRVLIMSLRSGAGVDGLQEACSTVGFGELDWAYGMHEQAEGRVQRDREGRKVPVFAYYFTTNVGSDPVLMDALGIKRGQLEGIRDPYEALVQPSQTDASGQRAKLLAEAYLRQQEAISAASAAQ